MRKSTIFISAVLTTFALVMIYGVVSAYRNISNVTEAVALTNETATMEPTTEPTSEPVATTAATVVTPEQAAQMAAQVVGNNNLLSAESASINGVNAYKITFTNNDVVYIGLDGQILAVEIAPVVVNVQAPAAPIEHRDRNKNDDSSNFSTAPSQSEDSHEEHED